MGARTDRYHLFRREHALRSNRFPPADGFFFGVWEPGVSRVIENNLKPGDVFVDVGANVGYDSLLAASRVGPDGAVVAIEALPRTFGLLQQNLARNPNLAASVRAVNVAVSDQPGTLALYEFGPHNIGAVTTLASRGGARSATVAAERLGNILTADEIARVRLVKMDVEGAEPAVLKDILDHLDAYPTDMDIIIEANPQDDPEGFADVFDRLRSAGFTAWVIPNRYTNQWYLRWREAGLRGLDETPISRHDLLLTRRKAL
jgi:FkbM family methyltransferase